MFYHIEGVVTELEQNLAVIDCAGVGYALTVTTETMSRLQTEKRAKLYVFDYIKEDCFDLYGFYSKSEKRCFEMLISVSGVGPKAAISILSVTSPESLAMAIMTGDEKALTAAPGIGKRIAQRVILELKDKIAKESSSPDLFLPLTVAGSKGDNSSLSDAVAALTVLGYASGEINAALKNLDISGLRAEEIIKLVLKQMVK